jgi:nanoRNase/pAp phosphatase (c-di-AMP/oligoRNAs hydrolase)
VEKHEINTIAEKNRLTGNIIDAMFEHDDFLLLGHISPDTDCVASLAAFALVLRKLQRDVSIFLPGVVAEQFNYLLAICKYNGITVLYGNEKMPEHISALAILDTPKPDMIAKNKAIDLLLENPAIRKLEIDHHLEADAEYAGDPGYCLVSEASSTCELIGYLCFKLSKQTSRIGEVEIFSRNIALALLTGIVGDSHMGKYLKSAKERWYYNYFSSVFDKMLVEKTLKNSRNLSSMEAIFDVIQRFSVREKKCFDRIIGQKQKSKSLLFVCLEKKESEELFALHEAELIVNVSKAVADTLAEESGKLGMVAYYDKAALSDYVQFRLRRSARFTTLDLREVLEYLKISNGGGHPGAVGFRVKKDTVPDIAAYTQGLVAQIETLIEAEARTEAPH